GQLLAYLQDQLFQGGLCATSVVRGTGAVGPIDAIEATAFGPLHPGGDRGSADAELPSDGAERPARANGGYHGPATLLLTLCLLMEFPRSGSLIGGIVAPSVQDVLAPDCSGRIGTCPMRERFMTPEQLPADWRRILAAEFDEPYFEDLSA